MAQEWHELTKLTGDRPFTVTSVRLNDTGIEIHNDFELPPLAGLRYEDQVFVGEFVRAHGSIKHMEKAFGVSYPTIKNRLNRIASALNLVQVDVIEDYEPEAKAAGSRSAAEADAEARAEAEAEADIRDEILSLLENDEITAAEAAERLRR